MDKIRIYAEVPAEYWDWNNGHYTVRPMSAVRAALAISDDRRWNLCLVTHDETYAEWELSAAAGDEGRGGPEG